MGILEILFTSGAGAVVFLNEHPLDKPFPDYDSAKKWAVAWMRDHPPGVARPRALPQITYKGKLYFVDFRLEELRSVKTAKSLPFTKLKAGRDNAFKKKLRALRFRTSGKGFIKGLDD